MLDGDFDFVGEEYETNWDWNPALLKSESALETSA